MNSNFNKKQKMFLDFLYEKDALSNVMSHEKF